MQNNDSNENSPNPMNIPLNEDFSSDYKIIPLKKYKLKLKYTISIIIFVISLIGVILNYYTLLDMSSSTVVGQSINNLTYLSNKTMITKYSTKRYNNAITNYNIMRIISFIIQILSTIAGFASAILFYVILKKKELTGKVPKILKNIVFWNFLTIGVFEYSIIVMYLAMYAKLNIILEFLSTNIDKQYIIVNRYEELYSMINSNKKYQMILASYTIIGLVIIVYYLKQLLVFNHFFIIKNSTSKENDDSPIETEMTFFTPTIDNKNTDEDN